MTRNDKTLVNPAGRGWEQPLFIWIGRPIILFVFWLLLSGHFEVQFLILGALASVLTAALTNDLLRPSRTDLFQQVPQNLSWLLSSFVRFLMYVPYLLVQIVRSNLEVAYLVLHPRMPIAPRLVEFKTPLRLEPAQVLLAQSITLTPGTVTVDVRNGRFLVHSLYRGAAQGLTRGHMIPRVGNVFGTPAVVTSLTVVQTVDDVMWFYEED